MRTAHLQLLTPPLPTRDTGNMAVVLLAMGGYGSWLGWQIRVSDDGVSKGRLHLSE